MKMTRLEAIKEWGRASREGRQIPEHVKTVLLSTQHDRAQAPLIVPAKFETIPSEQAQSHNNVKASKKSRSIKSSNLLGAGISGAITAQQMDSYNQQRKDNTRRYSSLVTDFISSGLSRKEAARKAKAILAEENSVRIKEAKKVKQNTKKISRQLKKTSETIAKSDPWLAAKVKQDQVIKIDDEKKALERSLSLRPICCIECKVLFNTFNGFVDHTMEVHKVSVSSPKLIKNEFLPIKTRSDLMDEFSSPSFKSSIPVKAVTASVEKTPESFNDKWIRLFSDKGYSVAMVDVFKREATKRGMTLKQIHDFLSACKPSKTSLEKTPHPVESTMISGQSDGIGNVTEPTLKEITVSVNNPDFQVLSDAIEKAIFAERIVKTRVNQNDFKERVAANFGYRCAITGSGEALEAAHIEPVGMGNNNTSNGVLMLACLHRLFDAGLMAIDPESLTIHFKQDCTYFAKDILEGKILHGHSVSLNKSGLIERWSNFNA